MKRAIVAAALCAACAGAGTAYPPARQDNVKDVLHGVEIVDPYRWLEDGKSAETRAWIDAENRLTHAELDGLPARAALRERLGGLLRVDRQTLPIVRGGKLFMERQGVNDELGIATVRDSLVGPDRVLLDPHALSADHTTNAAVEDVSRDGRRAIYDVRVGGEDETALHVRDVATGQDLPDVLPRALYRGTSWDGDAAGFYYALQDRKAGIRIRYHRLGTAVDSDRVVFGAGYGPSDWVSAHVSENGRWLLYTVGHGWARNDLFVQALGGDAPVVAIAKDIPAKFQASFAGDRLLVVTDWKSPTGRLVEVDVAHPEPERWREIVPARAETIENWRPAGGKIVVQTLHDVASRLEVFALDGEHLAELPLPGHGSVAGLSGRWDGSDLFYQFTSFTHPRATYHVDLDAMTSELFWKPTVPFDPDAYETRQEVFTSKDGTRVPMFIVARKGTPRDGRRPTLLSGYGGFAVSIVPSYRALPAVWLERGGVYAVANLRGGSEYGEEWHKAGMLANKQHVFDDFIAAAEYLVASKVTDAEHLAIQGGSNGGLLVGAVMTQRPELYRAVLCEFPDLDMLGYYRFENNNPPALLEYGDASKPDEFRFLAAYSPYQKVTPGVRYPSVLFVTGDADTRVPPLQARKMTARMQAATAPGGGRPILLLYDTKAGHSGGQPLSRRIEDMSLELAFLAREVGL